jgi:hypothetical protein
MGERSNKGYYFVSTLANDWPVNTRSCSMGFDRLSKKKPSLMRTVFLVVADEAKERLLVTRRARV